MQKWPLLACLILLLQLLDPAKAYTQESYCGNISIDSAELRYDMGRLDECITGLLRCLQVKKAFTPDQKTRAFHILAKCYLATDSINRADSVIEELLLLKDNFETDSKDPERFKTRVALMRSTLISSVSKRNEDIRLAPATTTIITAEEILQRGYTDLIEILKDIPGFDISIYYGQLYANVYQRGFRTNNTDKTLLLVDGVEENDLWSNFADISQQYPITNIKRIEVIYGPASTMYGPTAFSGVINIITKEPADYLKNNASFGINASTGTGTYNTRYLDVSTAFKKGIFSISVSGRFYHSDRPDLSHQGLQNLWEYNPERYTDSVSPYNYRAVLSIRSGGKDYLINNNMRGRHPFYRVSNDTDKIVLRDAGMMEAIRLNQALYTQDVFGFDYTAFDNPSNSSYITTRINIADLSLGLVTWTKNEGIGTTYTDFLASVSGSRWITGHSYAYLKYTKRLNDKLLFSSFVNYRIHAIKNGSKITTKQDYSALGGLELKDLEHGVPASWLTTYYFEQSEQFRAEFKMLYTQSKYFYINSGLELRNGQLQGYYLTSTTSAVPQDYGRVPFAQGGNQYNVNDVGVYVQGNYRTKHGFGITLGGRLDYNQIRSKGGLGYHVSPRFVIDYSVNSWIFKGILSNGIASASNFTKYDDVNVAPNPSLRPEVIYNYEVSAAKKISESINADIDFYYSRISDVVSAALVNRKLQNLNIGEFNIKGLQANLYFKSFDKKWQATLNYSYTDPVQTTYVDTLNNVVDVDLAVPDIASHKVNGDVNWLLLKYFNINLRANYLSKKKTGDGTSLPTNKVPLEGYFITNGTLSIQNLVKHCTLQFGCNNIFNKTYYSPGIRTAGGVRVPNVILQMGRNFFLRFNYEL